jgi:superfamily II DNA helicase RecQ
MLTYYKVRFMNSIGVASTALTGESLHRNKGLWKEIDAGKYRMLFASPEILLTPASYFWHKVASNKQHPFVKRLCRRGGAIIVDEAHVIWKWGASGFRLEYRNIGNLRTYFPNTPFLLLSATIPPHIKGYLHSTLHLNSPTYILQRSIARANIQLFCARLQSAKYADLEFLLPAIGSYSAATVPKTMIFVDSRNEAQTIAGHLRRRLQEALHVSAANLIDAHQTICVFSAIHDKESRDEHMDWFLCGDCRILVCTDAAGMGMNIPNIEVVIQYRLSENITLSDLWQRLGRCARDQAICGLALVFVDEKFILPYQFDDSASHTAMEIYTRPVTSHQEVHELYTAMYNRSPGSVVPTGSSPYSKLDPGILWLVNTYGCRAKVLLACFDDQETFHDIVCKCDNCLMMPIRTASAWDRRLPPPEALVPPTKKFARGEKIKYRNQLQTDFAEQLKNRHDTIHKTRELAESHSK